MTEEDSDVSEVHKISLLLWLVPHDVVRCFFRIAKFMAVNAVIVKFL